MFAILNSAFWQTSDGDGAHRRACFRVVGSQIDPGDSASATSGAIAALVSGTPVWSPKGRGEHRRASLAITARLICEAYDRSGVQCLGEIGGRFALLLLDGRAGTVSVVADPFGQTDVFWGRTDESLVVGTDLRRVRTAASQRSIDPQSIYDYFYFHCIPGPRTIWKNVRKIGRAQVLQWAAGQPERIAPCWRPSLDRSTECAPDELTRSTRAALQAAVDARCDDDPVFTFLSGGLDSSSVTGMAARGGRDVTAVSIGFDVPRYDELEYARAASSHFGVKLSELKLGASHLASVARFITAAVPQPFGNSSIVPTYLCARLGRELGAHRMLAGDGGDELFAGNQRYLAQQMLERRSKQVTLGGLLPLASGCRWMLRRSRMPPRVSSSLRRVLGVVGTIPERLQAFNFLHRVEPTEVFQRKFLASVDRDAPFASWNAEYDELADTDPLDRMLYVDWKYTLQDSDLFKVNWACAAAGIEPVFPMLEPEVVDASCAVPSGWKIRSGELRYHYKQAFSGFLPEKILLKPKHGFGMPFGLWLRSDPELARIVLDALQSFKSREIVEPSFIDRSIDLVRSDYAPYYGELVWLMFALEAWLDANA